MVHSTKQVDKKQSRGCQRGGKARRWSSCGRHLLVIMFSSRHHSSSSLCSSCRLSLLSSYTLLFVVEFWSSFSLLVAIQRSGSNCASTPPGRLQQSNRRECGKEAKENENLIALEEMIKSPLTVRCISWNFSSPFVYCLLAHSFIFIVTFFSLTYFPDCLTQGGFDLKVNSVSCDDVRRQ